MRRNHYQPDRDDERRRLESRLWNLLHVVLHRVPEVIRRVARESYGLKTREAVWEWHDKFGKVTVENAVPIRSEEGERAYCPLCGAGAQSPTQEGFAFPNGLEMHLFGRMSVHECAVMHEIRDQALDRVKQFELAKAALRQEPNFEGITDPVSPRVKGIKK